MFVYSLFHLSEMSETCDMFAYIICYMAQLSKFGKHEFVGLSPAGGEKLADG